MKNRSAPASEHPALASGHPAWVCDHPLPKCFAERLLVIRRGKGARLQDRAGRWYLDFTGGIAVNALGYGRADLARIAARQMRRLTHISNLYTTEPLLELGARMLAAGGFAAVQFLNSGSEANETALKYARLYSLRRKGEGCHRLLCFSGAFHGRTLGAVSVTPTAKYQDPFRPLLPGAETAPYNDPEALEKLLDRSFAGVIVEVVQGEGGLSCMSPDFAQALNRLCREHDAILIADEVQTGLGRTGALFASRALGLEPDIITLAKPLAGGLPLAAALLPAKVNELIHLGEHGTTFGGGPVTTAVACRVWDLVNDPGFLAGVREKEDYLRAALRGLAARFPFLGEVRGRGLLQGLEVKLEELPAGPAGLVAAAGLPSGGGQAPSADPMGELLAACQEEGLLILRAGVNVLRIAPPLVITKKEIDEGVARLTRALERYASNGGGK
jgi:acetylornithine/N-succinyldiaminopimelate aminotransferase